MPALLTDLTPATDPSLATDATLASGRWQACAGFAADASGTPVCAGCGWLADEHTDRSGAVIRRLSARAPRTDTPRRLAS